jgi:lipopolysaccharide export LptBFGC system permease protein LptF
MVADTARPESIQIYFAEHGRLAIDRAKRTVDLVLGNGTKYTTGNAGETDTMQFEEEIAVKLNPEAVFPPVNIQKGPNEKTIGELREDAAKKAKAGISPHPEVIALQQKFSFPVACLVFGLIGLALGLTVARDGKLAGFVVGVIVIFAYYVVMFLAESLTKGHYLNSHLSRWVPNIALGAFGIGALVWRSRVTSARLPFTLPVRIARTPRAPASQRIAPSQAAAAPRPKGVVVVIRIPRFAGPAPGLLDRYVARAYLRVAGIAFFAVLGLLYISSFLV